METATLETPSTDVSSVINNATASVSDLTSSNGADNSKPTEQQIIDSMTSSSKEDVKSDTVPEVQADDAVAPKADAAAEPPVEEEIPLTEEDLSIAKLQEFVKATPELKAALDKNPSLRNTVYAMARRSAKLNDFQGVFATVDAAKFAATNSEQFMHLNDMFFGEGQESAVNFWNALYENSLLKDPQSGNFVLDQTTQKPISTGAYERVAGAYREAMFYQLEQIASSQLPQDQRQGALDAIAWVKELAGDAIRPKAPADGVQYKLTPQQERELAEAKAYKQKVEADRQTQQTAWQQETFSHITTSIKDDISAQVKRIVDTQKVALTPYEQKNVVNDIFSAIDELAGNSTQFQAHFNSLLKRAPMTEQGRKSLVAEANKFYKEVMPPIVAKILKDVTSSTVSKQVDVTNKRVQQTERKEVKTTGGAPSPSPTDIKSKAQELRKQLKRPLTEDEIMSLT